MLMEEAERIAREEHGSHKLAVISGVGTRHYYRKLGYELEGTYMIKFLNEWLLKVKLPLFLIRNINSYSLN